MNSWQIPQYGFPLAIPPPPTVPPARIPLRDHPVYRKIPRVYMLRQVLGRSAIGIVFRHERSGDAVKIPVRKDNSTAQDIQGQLDSILAEVAVYARFGNRCPYIVQSRGSSPISLVMEYMPKGDLWNRIHLDVSADQQSAEGRGRGHRLARPAPRGGSERARKRFSRRVQLDWARDLTRGLDFMHQSRVLHCDIATRNVLLDINMSVKYVDFSHARLFPQSTALRDMRSGVYCVQYDIALLGSVLYEIATGIEVNYSGMVEEFENEQGHVTGRISSPHTGSLVLGWVMEKCWKRRYLDAGELAREVEAVQLVEGFDFTEDGDGERQDLGGGIGIGTGTETGDKGQEQGQDDEGG